MVGVGGPDNDVVMPPMSPDTTGTPQEQQERINMMIQHMLRAASSVDGSGSVGGSGGNEGEHSTEGGGAVRDGQGASSLGIALANALNRRGMGYGDDDDAEDDGYGDDPFENDMGRMLGIRPPLGGPVGGIGGGSGGGSSGVGGGGRRRQDMYDEDGIRMPDPVQRQRLVAGPTHVGGLMGMMMGGGRGLGGLQDEEEFSLGRAEDPSVDWMFPPPRHLSSQATLSEVRALSSLVVLPLVTTLYLRVC
jgi:hypothetical protein